MAHDTDALLMDFCDAGKSNLRPRNRRLAARAAVTPPRQQLGAAVAASAATRSLHKPSLSSITGMHVKLRFEAPGGQDAFSCMEEVIHYAT